MHLINEICHLYLSKSEILIVKVQVTDDFRRGIVCQPVCISLIIDVLLLSTI